jgi:hypothetical protein
MSRTSTVSATSPWSPMCRQRVPPSSSTLSPLCRPPVTDESTPLSPMYRLFFVTHVPGPYPYPPLFGFEIRCCSPPGPAARNWAPFEKEPEPTSPSRLLSLGGGGRFGRRQNPGLIAPPGWRGGRAEFQDLRSGALPNVVPSWVPVSRTPLKSATLRVCSVGNNRFRLLPLEVREKGQPSLSVSEGDIR